MERQGLIKKHILKLRSGRKCNLKFELIKDMTGLEMYGDIPCLPIDYDEKEGERFLGEESDSWLLLDDFVKNIDKICTNDLDYGDVDYFNKSKCIIIKSWLEERKKDPLSDRLQILYQVLEEYIEKAITLGTGVVIGL